MSPMLPTAKDKPLFTPGPLTTSATIKQAMLRDLGSRDFEFISTIKQVREKLLKAAGVSQQKGYEAVPLQGSGTYGIEAVLTCAVPKQNGKWLIVINGAYGDRMSAICTTTGIDHVDLKYAENLPVNAADVDKKLAADPAITAVAVVHCETTTGIINPIQAVGAVCKKHGKMYFVDSMSAFGAVPFDFAACEIDFLVSSSNKCIEGVPGFTFAICKRDSLLKTKGWSRTVVLDLLAQWQGLEKNGQFRFTPPTHVILAFNRALDELEMEGGVPGRAARYKSNYDVIVAGMRKMGFKEYLPAELQGNIITSFRYPEDKKFDFEAFYTKLNDRGFVIYPGKVSNADCFRIGTIGRLFPNDMQNLLAAIAEVIKEMGITLK